MTRLAKPLLFTAGAIVALVVFVAAGGWSPASIDVADLSGWLAAADPVDALAEIARMLGIVLAAYVTVVSAIALVAELADMLRLRRLTRALRRLAHLVAVPALRKRLLEATAVVTITASSMQAIPAGAAPLPRSVAVVSPITAARLPAAAEVPAVRLGAEFAGFDLPSNVEPSPTTIGDRYVIQAGDTLWSIAEHHYGYADADLLGTIASANPQIRDPDLILSGWTVVLPLVAEPRVSTLDGTPEPVGVAEDGDAVTVTVEHGDTIWDIVDRHYATGATAELVWATAAANPEITDPNLIFPGQLIVLPPLAPEAEPPVIVTEQPPVAPAVDSTATPTLPTSPASPAASPDPAPTTTAPVPAAAPAPPVTVTAPPRPTDATTVDGADNVIDAATEIDESTPSVATVVGWTGAAALAAGLLAMARRRRRRQPTAARHARRSRVGVDVGVALMETANVTAAERAALALRLLGSRIASRRGEATPVPRLLRMSDTEIELLWDMPNGSPVEPWQSTDGGWSWTLAAEAALATTDAPSPCPAFVTIGKRDGADVLLNLEGCGVLSISGDRARDVARSIAAELACSVFAESSTVLVVGDIALVGDPDRARQVEPTEAAGWLRDRSEAASALLAGRRLTSLFALRARSKPLDAHEPVVVVVDAQALDDGVVDELTGLAHGDLGAIVVLLGANGGSEWRLAVSSDGVRLAPLGLDLDSVTVSDEFVEAAAEFIPDSDPELDESFDDAWEEDPVEESDFALTDHLDVLRLHDRCNPLPVRNTTPDAMGTEADQWDVELKVLGQVRAVGAKQQLTPTELHLAIYLAFNRDGQNADTIATMLWPNGISVRTLTNAMAALRRKLGIGSDGEPLFPLGRDRQYTYRLSDRVVTDWDRFVTLVARAENVGDEPVAVAHLDEALALVDGPPFRAATGYSWAYSDGSATLITDTVEAVARRAAQLHESSGNDAGVAQARYRVRRVRGVEDEDEVDGEQIELPWRDVTSP